MKLREYLKNITDVLYFNAAKLESYHQLRCGKCNSLAKNYMNVCVRDPYRTKEQDKNTQVNQRQTQFHGKMNLHNFYKNNTQYIAEDYVLIKYGIIKDILDYNSITRSADYSSTAIRTYLNKDLCKDEFTITVHCKECDTMLKSSILYTKKCHDQVHRKLK